MSLEQTITDNTLALRELIQVLSQAVASLGTAQAPQTLGTINTAPFVADDDVYYAVKTPAVAPAPVVPVAQVAAVHTYDSIKASVIALGKLKGRAASVSLLAEFAIKTLTELPESQYAEFDQVCDMMLAAE